MFYIIKNLKINKNTFNTLKTIKTHISYGYYKTNLAKKEKNKI